MGSRVGRGVGSLAPQATSNAEASKGLNDFITIVLTENDHHFQQAHRKFPQSIWNVALS